jgi:hypothetical protein
MCAALMLSAGLIASAVVTETIIDAFKTKMVAWQATF